MASVVRALLRIKGEASAIKLAFEILQRYKASSEDDKKAFFYLLLNELGPNNADLDQAIANYTVSAKTENYLALLDAIEPLRQDLIRTLNWTPKGTSSIIKMRADLLGFLKNDKDLRPVDYDFQHLLSSWFNRGFLELRRISWETPAFILEKLIHYEAVHEITDWGDLQRRLADPMCQPDPIQSLNGIT
jgi:malonyl-CoA decarboxylase